MYKRDRDRKFSDLGERWGASPAYRQPLMNVKRQDSLWLTALRQKNELTSGFFFSDIFSRYPAEDEAVKKSITADSVGSMDTAGNFAGCI